MTNVQRLLIELSATLAVPVGGGLADGVRFLTEPDHRAAVWAEAQQRADQALALVKAAPDNPYGTDDEAIAGELLRRIAERKEKQRGGPAP